MDPPPRFLSERMLYQKALLTLASVALEHDRHDLARFGFKWYRYFEDEIDLADEASILAAREEFIDGFVELVPDYNLGQEPSNDGLLFALCFATEECRTYDDLKHKVSRMKPSNASLRYKDRNTLRTGLLEGGTSAKALTTDKAVQLVAGNTRMVDVFPQCCRGEPGCRAGNDFDVFEAQLKADLAKSDLSDVNRVRLFVLIGGMNIAFHAALQFARTSGKTRLHVHFLSLKGAYVLLGRSTFGVLEMATDAVEYGVGPHPEFTVLGIGNKLISTREKVDIWTAHFFRVLQHFRGKKIPGTDIVVQAPSSVEQLKYYLRKAGYLNKTPEMIEEEIEARLVDCSKGGTTTAKRKTRASCTMGKLMVAGATFHAAAFELAESDPEGENAYKGDIAKVKRHMNEIKQYRVDYPDRVVTVEESGLEVALVQQGDEDYGELYNHITYVLTLPLDNWRRLAWWNEGYDWTGWTDAVNARRIGEKRRHTAISEKTTINEEIDARSEDEFDIAEFL